MAARSVPHAAHTQLDLFDSSWPWSWIAADVEAAEQSGGCQGVITTSRILEVNRRALWVMAEGRCRLDEAHQLVRLKIDMMDLAESSRHKLARTAANFFKACSAQGVEFFDQVTATVVDNFIWSASLRAAAFVDVTPSTAANRQWVVAKIFDLAGQLGLCDGAAPVGPPIDRLDGVPARPLDEIEMRQVRIHAYESLIVGTRALVVALAEAGADAREIAQVTRDDIDLDSRTVRLGVTVKRVNPMTEWSVDAAAAVLGLRSTSTCGPVCVAAAAPLNRAAHSIGVRLGEVLVEAGLSHRRGVTASSVRLTAGLAVLRNSGIVEAARFLGSNSLDATATALNFDWRANVGP